VARSFDSIFFFFFFVVVEVDVVDVAVGGFGTVGAVFGRFAFGFLGCEGFAIALVAQGSYGIACGAIGRTCGELGGDLEAVEKEPGAAWIEP
jgi:hypothetical protein